MTWADIQEAKLTEEVGLKHPVEYTEHERRVIATHEAGHATVAYVVGSGRKLEILSIIKRSDALGLLGHSDLEERFTKTRSELVALIEIGLGGMVAEEQFFGEWGTGAGGDLQSATLLAAQMVGSLGMGGVAHLIRCVLGRGRTERDVESALQRGRQPGCRGGSAASKEARRGVVSSHREVVVALRDALLERDELLGDEIIEVIEGALPTRRPKGQAARNAARGA